MEKRTIFIGDIHGCYEELVELLDILHIQPTDQVISVGDMINKWPFSAKVVQLWNERWYEAVLWNHELNYQEKFNTKEAYVQIRKDLADHEHEWIMNLPILIEEDTFIVTHAGLIPHSNQEAFPPSVRTRIRTWNHLRNEIGGEEDDPWYDSYTGTKPVIYGHWAVKWLNIRHNTIGLDSGCLYGGKLSAYILENKEVVQVSAKHTYIDPSKDFS